MNVDTITIDQALAEQKLREYAALPTDRRTPEDALLIEAYRAAAEGLRLIDVPAAIRTIGLNERGEPRLAMARADWAECVFHPHHRIGSHGPGYSHGAGLFTYARRLRGQLRTNCFSLPAGAFGGGLTSKLLVSRLPLIPPELRPRTPVLRRRFILFEVERWEAYPADPFLLRHIAGPFYTVEAEWELTELEVSLLSARASWRPTPTP